jgi:hypothetical protein
MVRVANGAIQPRRETSVDAIAPVDATSPRAEGPDATLAAARRDRRPHVIRGTFPVLLNSAILAAALVLGSLIFPAPAYAYIDPVSGSIILQVVAAGALAAVFTFKKFAFKLRQTARNVWTRIWNP